MEGVARAVVQALERGDSEALRRVLHPYLHWSVDGITTRGRTRVLALLEDPAMRAAAARPASYELRDGQVYRWTVGASSGSP